MVSINIIVVVLHGQVGQRDCNGQAASTLHRCVQDLAYHSCSDRLHDTEALL